MNVLATSSPEPFPLPNPPLGLDEVQDAILGGMAYPNVDAPGAFAALGLAGEVGELWEKLLAELFPDGPPASSSAWLVHELWWSVMGFVETSKRLELLKKHIRSGKLTDRDLEGLAELKARWEAVPGEAKSAIADEQADTFFYEAVLARDLGRTWSDLARWLRGKQAARRAKLLREAACG